MEVVIAVAVAVIVGGLGMVAGGRGRHEPPAAASEVVPHTSQPDQAPVPVVLEDADGTSVLIEPCGALPEAVEVLPPHVAARLVDETFRAAPHLQRVVAQRGGELYRVVKRPPGGLKQVAGGGPNVRGYGMQGSRISGHAEFRKVRPAGLSPALALTLASAAVGAYWQQQMDATLRDIQTSLEGIRSRLDAELDAKLDLAERVLGEHEAVALQGRYDPPASITDGLQANLVERRQLDRMLASLESMPQRRMRHRDYHTKVLEVDGERLDEHAFRALRGLFIELRVLRLKRVGGALEGPAYQALLDQQELELREQLVTIQDVLSAALVIDGSCHVDGRRPELPAARRRRHRREEERTLEARGKLSELRAITDRLLLASIPPVLDDEPFELLIGTDDGQPRAYAVPISGTHHL